MGTRMGTSAKTLRLGCPCCSQTPIPAPRAILEHSRAMSRSCGGSRGREGPQRAPESSWHMEISAPKILPSLPNPPLPPTPSPSPAQLHGLRVCSVQTCLCCRALSLSLFSNFFFFFLFLAFWWSEIRAKNNRAARRVKKGDR